MKERIRKLEENIDWDFTGYAANFPHDFRSGRYECQQACMREELSQLKQKLSGRKSNG